MSNGVLVRAALLGASAGARSMTPLARLAIRRRGWIRVAAGVAAIGEIAFDKSPAAPSRLKPGPLAGRALLGAFAGGAHARRRGANVVGPAVAAGLVAVAASYAGSRWREYAADHDFATAGALAEDAAAIALAWASARD
jgi:uncharacterized membrane protein